MLQSVSDLENLLDVLNQELIPDMTFDQCFAKFSKHFSRLDQFKACTTICYLIESQVRAPNQITDIYRCYQDPSVLSLSTFFTRFTIMTRTSLQHHLRL